MFDPWSSCIVTVVSGQLSALHSVLRHEVTVVSGTAGISRWEDTMANMRARAYKAEPPVGGRAPAGSRSRVPGWSRRLRSLIDQVSCIRPDGPHHTLTPATWTMMHSESLVSPCTAIKNSTPTLISVPTYSTVCVYCTQCFASVFVPWFGYIPASSTTVDYLFNAHSLK